MFVFESIELGHVMQSIRPLLYRFSCEHFYYPLQASIPFEGRGEFMAVSLPLQRLQVYFLMSLWVIGPQNGLSSFTMMAS